MTQLALDLLQPLQPSLDNFVAGRNAEALAALRALVEGRLGERIVYLWGVQGSGRSHLLAALATLPRTFRWSADLAAETPGLSLVDLSEPPNSVSHPVRIYSGYSGWGRDQLEAEIATGSWYVVQASPEDPFDTFDDQWRRVLRRQSGFLSVVSTFPDDPSLN